MTSLEVAREGSGAFRDAIMYEIFAGMNVAMSAYSSVPSHLLHRRLVGAADNTRNTDAADLQIDEKQHAVGHQFSYDEACRRNVGSCQHREVDPNKIPPTWSCACAPVPVVCHDDAEHCRPLIRNLEAQIGERPDIRS